MRKIDGTWPPPAVLKALRTWARDRPYTRRRLTGEQLRTLPLSRIVEIGTADDIKAAWQKRWASRGRRRASWRPSLKCVYVLEAIDRKRAWQDVRDIDAKLRQMEEDLARRLEESRQYEAALEARRQRIVEARCRRLEEEARRSGTP